jgi:hypothetical protein
MRSSRNGRAQAAETRDAGTPSWLTYSAALPCARMRSPGCHTARIGRGLSSPESTAFPAQRDIVQQHAEGAPCSRSKSRRDLWWSH